MPRNLRKTNTTQHGGTQPVLKDDDPEKILSDSDSKVDSDDEFYADCDEKDETSDLSESICPKCKVNVKKEDPALQCEVCSFWYHNTCMNITPAKYEFLKSKDAEDTHWYCKYCQFASKSLHREILALKNANLKYEKKFTKLDAKVESNHKSLNNKLANAKKDLKTEFRDELASLETRLLTEIRGVASSAPSAPDNECLKREIIERKIAVDAQEQYSRKDSIRMHGIPFANNETSSQLENKVLEVINLLEVNVTRDDISVTHRLKETKKGDHPVMIKFMSRRAKDLVYTNKKKLKDAVGMKDVYITEDLTRLRFRTLLLAKKCNNMKSITTHGGKIKIWLINERSPITIVSQFDLEKVGVPLDLQFLGLDD